MNQTYERLCQAMSLRVPQADALGILADIAGAIPMVKNPDNVAALDSINAIENPKILKIKDFERDFPSICFSVATGVGKTRLMGAFITYLYLERGIKNFFIVAPNLTIYNKLIADFRDISNPKYVFQGIPEFAVNRPIVVTGDDYQNMGGLTSKMYDDRVKINVFNISKINRDERKAKSEFRSFKETLGQSYFNYLQSLPDLVLLMDEAHRYRADAGMNTINALGAVLGLELTATAKSTGKQGKTFKNIVYHYALAQAINDKYVKKPAIVGRTNFDKAAYDKEKLQEIKLLDGFKVHEDTKAELEVYAATHNARLVKPFTMIVASDTEHASALKAMIDSDTFLDGRYKGKVLEVHSNIKEDDYIELLLSIEKADNPIEVVIQVAMLGEGWDVNNLYTIIPLKLMDAEWLVEQSIGRGLRLPYGKHTGVDSIDRLNIVAHDTFAKIVQIAQDQRFDFQQVVISGDGDIGNKVAVDNTSAFADWVKNIGNAAAPVATPGVQPELPFNPNDATERALANQAAQQIEEKIKTVGSLEEIKSATAVREMVEDIVRENTEGRLDFAEDTTKIKTIVQNLANRFVGMQIQIPPIRIVRAAPKTGIEYQRFTLDTAPFDDLKPIQQKILVHEILENRKEEQGEAVFTKQYDRPQDYVIIKLMDYLPCTSSEDIDYLDFLATQVVEHIRTYAGGDEIMEKILFFNGDRIAREISIQAEEHKTVPQIETKVRGHEDGYISLRARPTKLLMDRDMGEQSVRGRPKNKNAIKSIVFNDFKKCLSTKAKFDSDTERQLAVLLEDTADVVRWERLSDDQARETFNLRYKKESEGLAAYCPDFVVETTDAKYIIETKAAADMTEADVKAKADVAKRWCAEASGYEQSRDGKPWKYLLVPHNDLDPTRTLEQLIADWGVR